MEENGKLSGRLFLNRKAESEGKLITGCSHCGKEIDVVGSDVLQIGQEIHCFCCCEHRDIFSKNNKVGTNND